MLAHPNLADPSPTSQLNNAVAPASGIEIVNAWYYMKSTLSMLLSRLTHTVIIHKAMTDIARRYGVQNGNPDQARATQQSSAYVLPQLQAQVRANGGQFFVVPPQHHVYFGFDPLFGLPKVTGVTVCAGLCFAPPRPSLAVRSVACFCGLFLGRIHSHAQV